MGAVANRNLGDHQHWFGAALLLVLAGCASEPRYEQPKGEGAFLQNRVESQGQARFVYYFEYVDGLDISPSEWSLSLPANARSKIYPGETVVGVQVIYTPAYGRNLFARMNDRMYYIFVRDLGFTDERLEYMSQHAEELDVQALSGLKGISFKAIAGKTYQAGARIENGQAFVWIEDIDGNVVSDTVLGIADPYCVRQTTYDAGTISCNANLRHGWAVLEGLPDPMP